MAATVVKSEHLTPLSKEGVLPREAPQRLVTFEQVYDEQIDFIWRSARRLGVDDASLDDVVQQVFLVVHRRLAEYEGHASTKTWLFAILLFVVREHRRTIRRKSPHHGASTTDPDTLIDTRVAHNPEQALERAEASRMIDRLLEELEDEKRVVFVMAELEQMTAVEISEATGLEPKAVYSRLRAARIDFERAAAQLRRRALLFSGRKP
jgi:RNA polymerase sigma-70 factor (ECF subfamily)